ncbi:c-type cytochrome [Shinella sp. CPCC 101442]|uniref:c-type cytochrome n=1 Tax=Shinella sp. CPCC 101442 TaxID=2932265 RepID=UPI0021539DD7|nr:c-type cytochrome [Shinella sp. CPCC 101442]MCR6502002.1 c-type cytochrome [Shinella sp. CPCC 101442]
MLIGWRHIVVLLLAGVLGALLVAWSGLISVKASTGHWKITDIVLHWVMRSSVRTAAIGTTVPVFTEGMLPMAAGHFEAGCAICHGSPAGSRPDSVAKMLPPPPDLKDKIAAWSDAELFQIVQHGVRYTGMPAWPVAGREDEAWAMVAFLRRYPELDANGYRDLAGSLETEPTLEGVIETCNGCHAPERIKPRSLIPRLAGQSATYLEQALAAYADGTRPSGIMVVAIERLDGEDRRALARHFAAEPARLQGLASENAARGEALAVTGDPVRRIPACLSCHDKSEANPAFPRLSGQPASYLENQLRLFVGKNRGGGPFRHVMEKAVANLKEGDINALVAYFADRKAQ